MENIILIAQQLHKEGKVPTTALLKARLPKNIPLPAIIQGLKMWKENPQRKIERTIEPTSSNADNENNNNLNILLDAKIEQVIAPLITQINELKNDIAKLQQQLTSEDKE